MKDDRAPLEHKQKDEIKACFHIFIKKDGSYRLNFTDSVFSVDQAKGEMDNILMQLIRMHEKITGKTIDLNKIIENFKRERYNRELNNKGYHTFCGTCEHELEKSGLKCSRECTWESALRSGWVLKKELTIKDLSN